MDMKDHASEQMHQWNQGDRPKESGEAKFPLADAFDDLKTDIDLSRRFQKKRLMPDFDLGNRPVS
jgi:hypothetical protein